MNPPNKNWTNWYCNVSHKMLDGIQYTLTNYENFIELTVYSWVSYQVIDKKWFFIREFGNDSIENPNYFWNCGDIETAIEWSKHYLSRCFEMEFWKNNLGNHKDHLYEQKST